MKVKVLKYCQQIIDGRLLVLDINKVIDIPQVDAYRLIETGLAQTIDCENKMLNIIYKKRGRPRKEA